MQSSGKLRRDSSQRSSSREGWSQIDHLPERTKTLRAGESDIRCRFRSKKRRDQNERRDETFDKSNKIFSEI